MEIMDEIIEHQKTNSGAFISTIERSFVLPEVKLLNSLGYFFLSRTEGSY